MKSQNSILILFGIVCIGLLPKAQAVSPPPDGGYPGGNTAEGQSALLSLTTGGFNTAVGYLSLRSDTGGSYNTAIGAGTLLANTADTNTAIGAGALLSNSTGNGNTANGALALFYNTTGYSNTANGSFALFKTTEGYQNTASGAGALFNNIDGPVNTANGVSALASNTSGAANTAVGVSALFANSAGNDNTAIGVSALATNSGNNNTAFGANAGDALTTGDNNIDIGYNVGGVAGESNTVRIGNTNITDTFIRGISGATSSGGAAVFVNGNGKLGTMTSSARVKDEIKPMDKESEVILALRPVRFRYKKEIDPQRIPQFGLIAEEVERVNPDLVIRDAEGKPQTVRYEQVNAMLLNEFLKAHRKIQEQEATITQLRTEMKTVVAHAKEQDSKIQKVSDQIEINKAEPEVVRNDPRRVESNTSSQ